MKKTGTVVFAWWFLAFSSSYPPTKIGPFKEKVSCDQIAAETKQKAPALNEYSHVKYDVSSCWEE